MSQQFDEIVKSRAGKLQIRIPEDFKKNLDKLLRSLPVESAELNSLYQRKYFSVHIKTTEVVKK